MQLRSGKTTTSFGLNQHVDDTNVFGSKTFVATFKKYIVDVNKIDNKKSYRSRFIQKIKTYTQLFKYLHKTIFYNNTSHINFITSIINKGAKLESQINIKNQWEICKGTPLSKTDKRTINAYIEVLTCTIKKYILIKDNLTLHNP